VSAELTNRSVRNCWPWRGGMVVEARTVVVRQRTV
jgi:hypothetical protein